MEATLERRGHLCFDCALLELRQRKDGRVVYWCEKMGGELSDGYIWRQACQNFRRPGS